ncbi:hypothetical protein Patl1_33468 [Pistacia atlantica]|uniref:Uncharacterized protein n=1 Tax=Pistacia atlantica TaxID=434234 RepID=A0ACC0ZR93_9ROSI|nr:hypothetical protein Patl1_33468 [Pistacia atlantica]
MRTVKVSNVSLGAFEQAIKEFFSFSGEIEHVEMHSGNEGSQIAYVVFKDPKGGRDSSSSFGALSSYLLSSSFFNFPCT